VTGRSGGGAMILLTTHLADARFPPRFCVAATGGFEARLGNQGQAVAAKDS